MDEAKQLIIQWVDSRPGESLSALSRRIGRNHAYLQQFVRTGTPKNLPEDDRKALAQILGVDETRLRGSTSTRSRITTASAMPAPSNARVAGNVQLNATIPVYGQAVGGKDGQFVLNGNKVADILAPPSLASVPGAYAVYVVGQSMEPRYFAGEAVYVNPRLPVRRNDFVVVQLFPDAEGEAPHAYVKRYISQDDNHLKLEQFSPQKSLKIPAHKVQSIHRIVMGGDG